MYEHQPLEQDIGHEQRLRALAQAIEQSPPADAPRIWIGSVDDYERGEPYGRWIPAARSEPHVVADIERALWSAPSTAVSGEPSAWGIFAAEGFGRHRFGAHATVAEITQQARAARDEARAFVAWASLDSGNRDHCLRFPDAYQGRFASLRDWVILQVEAAGYDRLLDKRIPAHLRPFVDIDIDALTHDLVAGGQAAAVDDKVRGGVWVFSPGAARQNSG